MTDTDVADPVMVEDNGPIAVIRVNRPGKLNALNLATKSRLVDAFRAADADGTVRVVVLTGTPTVFVAGTDIAEMTRLQPTDHLIQRTGEVFDVLDKLSKPTIAAVEGFALGGGCELALAADIVIAGVGAQFGQPEIRVGLIPGAGGTHRLVKMAGRQRALRLLLTGDRIGDEARSARNSQRDRRGRKGSHPGDRTRRTTAHHAAAIPSNDQRASPERRGRPAEQWPASGTPGVPTDLRQRRPPRRAHRLPGTPPAGLLRPMKRHAMQYPAEIGRVRVVGAGVMGSGIAQLAARDRGHAHASRCDLRTTGHPGRPVRWGVPGRDGAAQAATVIKALMARTGLPSGDVDDVILGLECPCPGNRSTTAAARDCRPSSKPSCRCNPVAATWCWPAEWKA